MINLHRYISSFRNKWGFFSWLLHSNLTKDQHHPAQCDRFCLKVHKGVCYRQTIRVVSRSISSCRIQAAVSLHIRAARWAPTRRGEMGGARCLGHPPVLFLSSCNYKQWYTVTAGEADVNSNIRFQSACTLSTLPRNREVEKKQQQKKPPPWQNPSKMWEKQLLFPAELNAEHVFAWQCSLALM